MRTAATNPFVPGSDAVPALWAGRVFELADIERLRTRRRHGQYDRGRAVLGPPGLGKSVFVRRIAADARADNDVVLPLVRLDLAADPVGAVAGAVKEAVSGLHLGERISERITAVLSRFEEISTPVGGLRLRDTAQASESITTLLRSLCDGVAPRLVHVLIDEIQAPDDVRGMSSLLTGLADGLAATREEEDAAGNRHDMHLNLVVLVSGLPSFWAAAERAGTTFARRLAPVLLRPIPDEDLRAALAVFTRGGWDTDGTREGHVTMSGDAVDRIVHLAGNDPFLFQLVGQAAWDAGTERTISLDHVVAGWEVVSPEAERHVRRLSADMSPREQQFIARAAELSPEHRSLTDIARSLGGTASSWADVAANLDLTHGILARERPYRLLHGALERLLRNEWP